jgi:CDP-diacylglycerol--glycerol-3-phosphate 3-phosphatidyltransferase
MTETLKTQTKPRWSLEMYLRKVFKVVIDPVAAAFLKIGITPNTITGIGFILSTVAAFLLAKGWFTAGGLVLLLAGPLDVIDGSMARLIGPPTPYGALIDSVTDRYSELVVLGGLLFFYLHLQNDTAILLIFLAAGGSILVSYVKARAEGLGQNCKVGVLTRVERLIIMIACLVFRIPMVALWVIAILANVTAIQRLLFVRKQVVKNAERKTS